MYFWKRFVCISMVGCICLLAGCGQAGQADSKKRENVFDQTSGSSETDKEKDGYITGTSVNVQGQKTNYEYNGEAVTIPYQYKVEGSDMNLGLLVLCDGICTPFSVGDGTPKLLNEISLNAEEQTDIPLTFIPIGKKGDTVNVEVIDIVDPDAIEESLKDEEVMNEMIQGVKGKVSAISGIRVAMHSDGNALNDTKDGNYTIQEFSKKEKETKDMEGFHCESDINGQDSVLYKVKQGEKIDITITYWGEDVASLHTAFFVDNTVFPAFDTKNYNECKLEKGKKTVLKAEIDTSDLKKGRHLCYSVCGDIDYMTEPPTRAFVLEVR